MPQRHDHDSVVTLPSPHADPASPMFVPIPLRAAFDSIPADVEERMKQALWTEISEPMWRTINGRHVILNHRSNDSDFDVALTWLKIDEARHRVARADERRASEERGRLDHTCRLCGRIDPSANSSTLVVSTVPAGWCQACRDEWHRQAVAEHAELEVAGKTVAALVAAARKRGLSP